MAFGYLWRAVNILHVYINTHFCNGPSCTVHTNFYCCLPVNNFWVWSKAIIKKKYLHLLYLGVLAISNRSDMPSITTAINACHFLCSVISCIIRDESLSLTDRNAACCRASPASSATGPGTDVVCLQVAEADGFLWHVTRPIYHSDIPVAHSWWDRSRKCSSGRRSERRWLQNVDERRCCHRAGKLFGTLSLQ